MNSPAATPAPPPDKVLRLLAQDGYQVHQLVYAALAKHGVRDFLFAPFAAGEGLNAVLVRPCNAAAEFASGQQFRMTLRAMPTVKMKGRRRSIGISAAKDSLRLRWLQARAQAHGFALLAPPEMRVERVHLQQRAKTPFVFNACIYRAPIRVADAALFARAYSRGVGQGRAWGCGMLILREFSGGESHGD